MAHLLHSVTLPAEPDRVFAALASKAGIAGWWTSLVERVDQRAGGSAVLPFDGGAIVYRFEIEKLQPPRAILWRTLDGAPEWKDTTLHFELAPDGNGTFLTLEHDGWHEETPFFAMCNTVWGHLLFDSLPEYLRMGTGKPIS